ncbi:MAG TPA: phage/plasmid primase, P4 family [Mycobacterium sp.]|nr:phage/plasmid primase, P4 family [Mycobacterium sp.]
MIEAVPPTTPPTPPTTDYSAARLRQVVLELERQLDADPTEPFAGVPHPSESTDAADPTPPVEYHLTELGNADRLADSAAAVLRYVHPWKAWLAWDGTRWRRDERGSNQEFAKTVVRQLFVQAEAARGRADRLRVEHADLLASATSSDRSKDAKAARDRARATDAYQSVDRAEAIADAMLDWAKRSSTAKVIGNMATLARSEPRIVAEPAEFDRQHMLLNVQNGTLDLETGKLHSHRQSDRITKICGAPYDPDARAPLWEKFLAEVQPDPDMREWLQMWFGYCLTGSISEQVMMFALGDGSNGKNLMLDTLKAIMGDYATTCAPDLLVLKNNDEHPTGFADLQGHRMVLSSEIDRGRKWAESTIKRLTGDKTIKARRMRENFYEFEATHKFNVLANNRPEVQGTDHGIWRRIRLAPFGVIIAKPDRDLPKKIATEFDGILAWAVRGCAAWLRAGRLGEVPRMRAAVDEYRADQDQLGEWLAERCVCVCDPTLKDWTEGVCLVCGAGAEPSVVYQTKSEEPWSSLYPDFQAWQVSRGVKTGWTFNTFRSELLKRPGVTRARNKEWRGAAGLRLRRLPGSGLSSRPDEESRRW